MGVLTFLCVIPRAAMLLIQLLWLWMTLGWRVRRARKAFEKELISQGVSKQDAQRISRQFKMAKDRMMSMMWQFGKR